MLGRHAKVDDVRHRVAVGTFVFLISAGVNSSAARTWHIFADGSGDTPTIQAAIDSSMSGDSILVAAGTYFENLNTLGKSLFLSGQSGPEVTVIDGEQAARVLFLTGGGVVEGFTIRNGRAITFGGGIRVQGSAPVTIRNNIIEDNVVGEFKSGYGGGVFLDQATRGAVVEDNIIRRNSAGDQGGGVFDDAGLSAPPNNVIRRNTVERNIAGISGGGLKLRYGIATENLVVNNWATYFGGGILTTGRAVVRNNTVVSNLTANNFINGAGIHACGGATIDANIVAYSGTDGPANAGAGIQCCDAIVTCNDLWGNDLDFSCTNNPPAASNFAADPLFCNLEENDYHLERSSPCGPEGTCGLVGAYGVACGKVRVETVRWGDVKSLYR